jgi:uncharacterized protein (DUF1015 family)
MGFISLLDLQDDESSKVYPHESTHAKAIDDRFKLTETLKSNLSSIFVCYSDKHRKAEKIFDRHVHAVKPMIDVVDGIKVRHRLWRLDDMEQIGQVCETVSGQQLFIADGHHRYKVAQEYRQLRLSRMSKPSSGAEPFNYVMTYFTNLDAKGLEIFPMHRIVKKMPKKLDFLEEYFRVDAIKSREDLPILLAKAGRNEHAFGLYMKDEIKLLRLKSRLLINKHVKEGSPEYKKLDATILKAFVFDKVGIKTDDITYTSDLDYVMQLVDERQADAGFAMNPVSIQELRSIALNGERMPPKTTYFYPKVLSGLTVYKME